MTNQLSQEDMNFIKDFIDKVQDNFSISGEMTLNKIGEYISKMPIGDIQHFGRLFKAYGYYGVMFAVKEALETGSNKAIYKYVIATVLTLMLPIGSTIIGATLYASAIGIFVGVTWDYIEENKDDLLNKLKELLRTAGIDIDDNGNISSDLGSFNNICPFPSKEDTICSIKERWDIGQCTRSPLVLDLDGDGISTTSTKNGVYFDHDANGFAENSSWIGKNEALLVRDINNNGKIDNGCELFGNNTILSDGTKAANGFEALKDLDSNADGVFNAADNVWNEIKIWQDANSDGTTDAEEIKSLSDAGISSINLNYAEQNMVDENGNAHRQTSSYTNAEGETKTISDIWFALDTTNTIDLTDIAISESIAALPDIEGNGCVHSLHKAMALDVSGLLQNAVEAFCNEPEPQKRHNMINELIYRWTEVYDMDPNGRNPSRVYGNVLGDCRKLEALERFLGTEYQGIWCDDTLDRNPHGQAAPYILEAFELLADFVWYRLSSQGIYKELFYKTILYWNNTEQKWQIDVSSAVEQLRREYETAQSATSEKMVELAECLAASNIELSDEIISAFAARGNSDGDIFERELALFGSNIATGNNGDDSFNGTEESDFFDGKGGNDRIWTWGGNDFIIGGRGDDVLDGGEGSDTYYWNWGDGFDLISDGSTVSADINKVVFGEGIAFNDLSFAQDGKDLLVYVKGDKTQGFRIFYQFYSNDYGIDYFVFADGSSVNLRNLGFTFNQENGASYAEGTAYDDIIHGTAADNILNGHEGNDMLYGYDGNDRLTGEGGNDFVIGGRGDDVLDGGEGSDTYYWNWGDGFDLISDGSTVSADINKVVFGEGIAFNDLSFAQDGKDLIVYVKGDKTQGFRIFYQFYSDDYGIDYFVFADGSSVNLRNLDFNFSHFAA